jgi:hypothetical protein
MSTELTRRAAIIAAVVDRLEVIRRENNFRTDAGKAISVGKEATLGEGDDAPALSILIPEDEVRWHGEHVGVMMPLEFVATIRVEVVDGWMELEALLGDIKEAFELEDRTLGGLVPQKFERGTTRTYEREAGSDVMGIVLTYNVPYPEMWGHP